MSTLKEIAKRAKVSVGTVDRVIHNRGRVAKETADRVNWIIEQLDYKPNVFAQQLRKSKDLTFGVLIPKPQIDSKYWQIPVRGMDKARKEILPHQITINYYFFDKYSERSFNNTTASILNEKLDGLLIAPVIADLFNEFLKKIPRTIANNEDGKQVVRSSGSVGANYFEANESLSNKDFRMRIKISRKKPKKAVIG